MKKKTTPIIPLSESGLIHPKLRNINTHNVTHFLISQNPREWMFVHFKDVFAFIPYSLRTSRIFFLMEILPPCAFSSNLEEEMANKEGLGVGVHVGC
jgi:hypothetical protein